MTEPRRPHERTDMPVVDATDMPVVDAAGRELRAPWAASVAGILFAIFFSGAIILLRASPLVGATDAELAQLFAEGQDLTAVIGGLYLAPFAGITFLWFVAVIRDQIGEREDRFFATVFFGSGLLFVAMLFAATAVASAPIIWVRYLHEPALPADVSNLSRAMSYAFLFAFATRAAGVFLIATATIGLRSRVFPKWFALTGYLVGLILLVAVVVWDWVVLALPVWVAIVSLFILRREWGRRGGSASG